MPGKLKVKILAGRNLPVMDRSGDTTDAYVELKFSNITYKTDVCRKSLNPQWNSEWYKFEVDDAELQDEPLQIRLMDHDTYSANDAIGKVYLNLNPLLLPVCATKNLNNTENNLGNVPAQGSVMMGWIPVYDTMHGIRGEVNLIVKVELFIDFNKFKQSSCGVQFFYSPNIPHGYHAQIIHGFVEELIVTDDPEYKWIDKIRTPRASNEARQTLFFKLSGEVQRKIGLKALDLGGNAVIGYQQNFDLEGEFGIVARGIGTAVTLVKLHDHVLSTDNLFSEESLLLKIRSKLLLENDLESPSRSPRSSPVQSPLPRMSERMSFFSRSKDRRARKTAVRVTERRPTNPFNRQLSLQSFSSQTNRSGDSSPSLSDYTLDDASLYSLDYDQSRATRRRFFSHSLKKKIKQLPHVIYRRSKGSDEESDLDTSSLGSTISTLRPKHKKLTHKKQTSDFVVASLIKSLHSGLLDSVREDRETPTPSPIKFLADPEDSSRTSTETVIEIDRLDASVPIPMISSSESDTSTEDEEDDHSDTSAIYNILDETSSFQDREKEQEIKGLEKEGSEVRELLIQSDFVDELISFEEVPVQNRQKMKKAPSESTLPVVPPVSYTVENEILKVEADPGKKSPRSKSPRRVERKNTVIYKGPSKTDLEQIGKEEVPSNVSTIAIIVDPPTELLIDPSKGENGMIEETLMLKKLESKYRKRCMADLINIIDAKLMAEKKQEEVIIKPFDLAEELEKELEAKQAVERLKSEPENEGTESQLALRELPRSLTCSDRVELAEPFNTTNLTDNLCVSRPPSPRQPEDVAHSARSSPPPLQATPTASKHVRSASVRTGPVVQIHRRSSDSDLSVTTKGSSLTNSDKSTTTNLKPTTPLVKTLTADIKPTSAIIRTMHQEAIEMLEYPFMTMLQYPAGFLLHIGGFVSARSVKLLERVNSLEDPEGRDYWWTEIRMEVRSHARSLGCNVVVGYREEISICDDICVLNASGTAAVINMNNIVLEDSSRANQSLTGTSVDSDRERPRTYSKSEKHEEGQTRTSRARKKSETDREDSFNQPSCSVCHLPYTENGVPFQMTTSKCAICRRAKVADVLFATTEMPENVPVTGRGSFIQATVCKNKKDLRGELNAKEISDLLPFLEYELHSMLYNKLRVKGMNAIFGLKTQVSIGEKLMVAMAVGTAVYITALPEPSVPHIASGNSWHDEEKLIELRRCLAETAMKNREYYQLKSLSLDTDNTKSSDTEDSEEDLPELDVAFGSKDVCVLEVDDVEDMERIHMLIDDRPPDGFHVVNTQTIPGLEELEIVRNLQMFTQVSRTKVPVHPSSIGPLITGPSKYFESVLQTVYFKLRRMIPCALCGLHFKVALPDQDDMQLSVIGMALGLGEPTKLDLVAEKKSITSGKESVKRNDDSEMIFNLEEDPEDSMSDRISNSSNTSSLVATLLHKTRPKSPLRMKTHLFPRPKHMPIKERYGVDITPLSYLPSGRIERYLGNLNFFFIRESTSIREGGGLSGFTHSFMTEILAIVRAHVTALGGNAMVSFFMTQCVLLHSPHKNQGQCLINVGGDVVLVSYFGNDRQQIASNC